MQPNVNAHSVASFYLKMKNKPPGLRQPSAISRSLDLDLVPGHTLPCLPQDDKDGDVDDDASQVTRKQGRIFVQDFLYPATNECRYILTFRTCLHW